VTGTCDVTVAICTRDRADSLAATLQALARVAPPAGLATEVVVIDNGSRDATAFVVGAFRPEHLSVRHVVEPASGVARCRNRALREARGRVICFLDDDVRPAAEDWLDRLTTRILRDETDAVAGGIRLAPHLERAWMTPVHRVWLASTETLDPHTPAEMVSANMAVGRRVLARVAGFDPELGPGALGYGEDALFAQQLHAAGYRIGAAFDALVEHHVDPRRLTRAGFLAAAAARGRTLAYRRHHWEHETIPEPRRRLRRRWLRLVAERVAHPRPPAEGLPLPELGLREDVALLRQYLVERTRPRNYTRHGLRKLHGVLA
jgi:glycosyltransferase involved in cell wall biosynthesis